MILPILAFYACLRGQAIRGFLFALPAGPLTHLLRRNNAISRT